ncbi:ladderlectin-like [Halichoeres trimaculatus]|uniref:ladderlectin-like n=1 Tax=Halichoeres trimaculatus TaxID=147232 RepID=UPI003D9F664E
MAAGLQVVVLCLISGLWIAERAECAPPTGRLSIACPPRWTPYNHRCYSFQPYARPWAAAEKHCTLMGGNLASIHSAGDYHFIRGLVYRTTRRHRTTWVGGYDAAHCKGVQHVALGSRVGL